MSTSPQVDRYATRAMHYVASEKVQDILVRLSQTTGSVEADNSMSDLMASKRNWSVNSNLSMLNHDSDSERDQTLMTGSPGLDAGGLAIPPTYDSNHSSTDYGSFDDEDSDKEKSKKSTKKEDSPINVDEE